MADKIVRIEKDKEKEKAHRRQRDKEDKNKKGEKEKIEDRVLRLEEQVAFMLKRIR